MENSSISVTAIFFNVNKLTMSLKYVIIDSSGLCDKNFGGTFYVRGK